jgi:predicted RND superfamily exporter protein
LIRGPKPLAPKLFSKRARKESAADGAPSDPLSVAIADAFTAMTRRKRGVLLLAGGIAVLSFVGLSRLVIDNVMVEYFKEGTDVVRSDAFIRRHFGGSKTLSVVVKAEKPGDVLDPAILGPMDRLARYLDGRVPEVGKVLSFTDLVKRVNQVYNADEPAEGIRAAARPQAGAQSSAQGAADGLGDLGDLGFGDFGSFEESAEPVASSRR